MDAVAEIIDFLLEAGPEKVAAASVRFRNGKVVNDITHLSVYQSEAARQSRDIEDIYAEAEEEGFTTSLGRFVDRDEAQRIAKTQKQWRLPKGEMDDTWLDAMHVMHDPNFTGMNESNVRFKRIDQWPIDFQVILSDSIESIGIEVPEAVKIKEIPAAPYFNQASKWEYGTGDERSRPEYQTDITAYLQGGGELPPIIVRGNELIDGRHRLLAGQGKGSIQVVDLNDLW